MTRQLDGTILRGEEASRSSSPFRLLLVMCATVGSLAWSHAPAAADPVLCATVSYELFGGPKNYVVDNCWIPSGWETQMGTGPDQCMHEVVVRICEGTSVALPLP